MAYIRTLMAAITVTTVLAGATLVPITAAAAHSTHVVEPGDTLSVIARSYGVSTADLAEANGITNHHLIRVGQTLKVPGSDPVVYVVEVGDSVSVIARNFGVSASDIVALNGLSDPNRIRVGQKLRLPSGADEASSLALLAARYPNLPGSITDDPERLALIPNFERWAAHYGVAPDLLMAMAYQESGWQVGVESSKGAIGIGQLLPSTAEWVATELIGDPTLNAYNADDNIRMSARFLLWLTGFLGGESQALAGYFQGPTSVAVRGNFAVTDAYVASVTAARPRFLRS